MDTAAKTGLVSLKSTSKKVFHKASEATGEFIRNKISDKIVKPKPVTDEKLRDVEELIVVPVKKRRNIEWIKASINIRYKTHMLRSDLCDHGEAYFVVKGVINVRTVPNTDINQKMLHLKIMQHLGHP